MEMWKPIFDGRYSVSSAGRVKNNETGLIRKTPVLAPGYPSLGLFLSSGHRQCKVHELVALAFLGDRPSGMYVDHIDGDKTNNAVENLEYVTPSENSKRAYRLGLTRVPGLCGEENGFSKLTVNQVQWAREAHANGATYRAIAKELGVDETNISKIVKRQRWRHVQ